MRIRNSAAAGTGIKMLLKCSTKSIPVSWSFANHMMIAVMLWIIIMADGDIEVKESEK